MKNSKVLLGTLFVLGSIIVLEVLYLYLTSKQTTNKCPEPPSTRELCTSSFPTTNPQQAMSESNLVNLRILNKGIVKSSVISYVIEGTIEQTEYFTREPNDKSIKFNLKADNGNINTLSYREFTFLKIQNSTQESIDLHSLKDGDKISIAVEYDLLNEAYQSVIITLL